MDIETSKEQCSGNEKHKCCQHPEKRKCAESQATNVISSKKVSKLTVEKNKNEYLKNVQLRLMRKRRAIKEKLQKMKNAYENIKHCKMCVNEACIHIIQNKDFSTNFPLEVKSPKVDLNENQTLYYNDSDNSLDAISENADSLISSTNSYCPEVSGILPAASYGTQNKNFTIKSGHGSTEYSADKVCAPSEIIPSAVQTEPKGQSCSNQQAPHVPNFQSDGIYLGNTLSIAPGTDEHSQVGNINRFVQSQRRSSGRHIITTEACIRPLVASSKTSAEHRNASSELNEMDIDNMIVAVNMLSLNRALGHEITA